MAEKRFFLKLKNYSLSISTCFFLLYAACIPRVPSHEKKDELDSKNDVEKSKSKAYKPKLTGLENGSAAPQTRILSAWSLLLFMLADTRTPSFMVV